MKAISLLALLLPWMVFAADDKPHPFQWKIERFDPAFDRLVASDAVLEPLAEGFRWAEGPVWHDGGVVFSDVLANTAYRWRPGAKGAEVYLKPSGQLTPQPGFRETGSNGLARDPQGRLLLCQHGERRVARWENGRFTALADRFEGRRFNSPNDLAVRRNGDVYFTDPPYGLEGVDKSPLREIPFHGVYRVTPAGEVSLLTKEIRFPNGIAFSPAEDILYVAVSDGAATRVMAYDVRPDGGIANPRVFFNAQPLRAPGLRGGCDGLKVDREGNVWTTGPGGVLVISRDGRLLGRLNTFEPTANCAWGDDGSTLYITANYFLVRVRTLTKGAGW